MAARFWRAVLGCELAFAALLATLLAGAFSLPAEAALALALALSLFAPGALVAASFVVAGVSAAGTDGSRDIACALRALCREAVDFNLSVLAMAGGGTVLLPADFAAAGPAAAPRPPRPLLLVHGIVCNRTIWQPWLPHLCAAGFAPIRAVNLEPLFADIETHARRVAQELRDLQRENNGAQVAIVAHSMGGLVARAALRTLGPGTISHMVTIACPHHGTRIARWFRSLPTRQMSPDSAWLRALNGGQEGAAAAACITSIYSPEDNLIVPPRSARVEGARHHELRGLGHLGLLSSRQTIEHAVAALAGL